MSKYGSLDCLSFLGINVSIFGYLSSSGCPLSHSFSYNMSRLGRCVPKYGNPDRISFLGIDVSIFGNCCPKDVLHPDLFHIVLPN